MKINSLCVIFLFLVLKVNAQNIGVNSSGATPNASALLDIDAAGISPKLGLLIPRVTSAEKTAMNPLPAAAQGLVVYQTDGLQGFYYNTSITTTPSWSYLNPSTSSWTISGNTLTGTLPSTPNEWIGSANAADWIIKTNNTERIRVNSTGNVGIGTTTPTATLEVNGSTKTTNFQMTNGASLGFVLQSNATGNASWVSPASFYTIGTGLSLTGNTINSVWTVSGVNIYNNNSGSVGIGTAAPSQKLHVSGGSILTDRAYAASTINIAATTAAFTTGANAATQIQITDNASATANGNLTYGATAIEGQYLWITNNDAQSVPFSSTSPATTIPAGKTMGFVYINSVWKSVSADDANALNWSITGNAGTTAGTNFVGTTDAVDIVLKTNNIERMRVLSNGNVGIGTTLPTNPLTIAGTGSVFGVDNTAVFSAKNSAAVYDGYLWPRWSDNVMYMNYGSGGFNIRNNGSANTLFMTNSNTIGIGTTAPDASAKLDITSTSSGLLIPRVALTASNLAGPIASPTISLLVYNTNTANTGAAAPPNAVVPGYYYWSGTEWVSLSGGPSSNDWSITGNAGTSSSTNFMGTTDSVALVFKVNNHAAGRIGLMEPISDYNTSLGGLALPKNTTGDHNTAIGTQALNSNTSGENNTAVGALALQDNISGKFNTAIGEEALNNNTTSNNTAVGYQAMLLNLNGSSNTAVGYQALDSNTAGSINTAIGVQSLFRNKTGINNTALGHQALKSNTGSNNTAVGTRALQSSTGNDNTSFGYQALAANTTGIGNTGLGLGSLQYNQSGDYNVGVGYFALGGANTGNNQQQNVALGSYAGFFNTSGTNNVFVGNRSGYTNSTGSNNIFFGNSSGYLNTTGSRNVIMGDSAGYSNTTGYNNIYMGNESGYSNTTGYNNVFIGTDAGKLSTGGFNNIFMGTSAGVYNSTGYNNIFIGFGSGNYNNTGRNNTFLGVGSGNINTTGQSNVFIGDLSGYSNTLGNFNVFIGSSSGLDNDTGDNNVFLGYHSGENNLTGKNNFFAGTNAGKWADAGNDNVMLGNYAGLNNLSGNANVIIGNMAGISHWTGDDNVFIGDSTGYSNTTAGYNTFIGKSSGYKNTTGNLNVMFGYRAGYYCMSSG